MSIRDKIRAWRTPTTTNVAPHAGAYFRDLRIRDTDAEDGEGLTYEWHALQEIINDEIIAQLAAKIRDHPLVRAALKP
jgi:hypothetical protein